MSGVFGGQMRENRDQDDVARKAADLCVRFLGETVPLDAQEKTFWRKVFLDNSVSREDLELSVSYLTIVPMEKRREWFGVLGFSPEVSVVSVWGTLRGYDSLAKYFSWQLRSTIGQNYEGEDYYVMFPEVGANGSCNDMCQYFGSSIRVGPEFMVKHSVRKIFPQDKVSIGELYEVRVKEPTEQSGASGFSSLFDEENRGVTSGKLGLQPTLLDVVTVEASLVASERLDELGFSFDDGTFSVQRMAVGFFSAKYVLRAVCNMFPSIRDLRLRYDGVDYSDGVVYVPRFRDAMMRWKFHEPLCHPMTVSKEIVQLGNVGYDSGGWTRAVEKGVAQLAHCELSGIVTFQQALDTVRGRFINWDRFPGVCRDGVDTAVYVGFSGSGFDKRMAFAQVVLQQRTKRGYDVLWSADWFPSNDEMPFDVTGLISYKDIEFDRVPTRLNCGRPGDEFSYGMFGFDGFNIETLKLLNAQPGVIHVEEKRASGLCGCGLRRGDEIDEFEKPVLDDSDWRNVTAERLSQLNQLLQNGKKGD